MRIVGSQLQQIVGAYLRQNKIVEPAAGSQVERADQVSFSRKGTDILRARLAYDRLPEVRQDKITEIRDQYLKGAYRLEDSKISQAIVQGIVRDKLLRKDGGQ